MIDFWNKRYAQEEWAYGSSPNEYLKSVLSELDKGRILFPAEGEGRNAVYAASQGWEVAAFDFSEEGKRKALTLAEKRGVNIDYKTCAFLEEVYPKESFDVIANIFVHFDPTVKTLMHERLSSYLKVGGYFIMEVFSKNHRALSRLNPAVGGPEDTARMYDEEEIEKFFPNFEFLMLEECKVSLQEGRYHNGESAVLRFLGKKIA